MGLGEVRSPKLGPFLVAVSESYINVCHTHDIRSGTIFAAELFQEICSGIRGRLLSSRPRSNNNTSASVVILDLTMDGDDLLVASDALVPASASDGAGAPKIHTTCRMLASPFGFRFFRTTSARVRVSVCVDHKSPTRFRLDFSPPVFNTYVSGVAPAPTKRQPP